jgi:cleavage stimulation factor subunit 1
VLLQPPPPSDKLFRLVTIAKQFVEEPETEEGESKITYDCESSGLDLEYDADITPTTPEPCTYETVYLTSHKGACRAAAFTNDGKVIQQVLLRPILTGSLFATGSEDSSIKILDVEKIIGRSVLQSYTVLKLGDFRSKQDLAEGSSDLHHPVIRTLYDHISVI